MFPSLVSIGCILPVHLPTRNIMLLLLSAYVTSLAFPDVSTLWYVLPAVTLSRCV